MQLWRSQPHHADRPVWRSNACVRCACSLAHDARHVVDAAAARGHRLRTLDPTLEVSTRALVSVQVAALQHARAIESLHDHDRRVLAAARLVIAGLEARVDVLDDVDAARPEQREQPHQSPLLVALLVRAVLHDQIKRRCLALTRDERRHRAGVGLARVHQRHAAVHSACGPLLKEARRRTRAVAAHHASKPIEPNDLSVRQPCGPHADGGAAESAHLQYAVDSGARRPQDFCIQMREAMEDLIGAVDKPQRSE
mmetsp:Transcript_33904/g.72381  ORF Transcript_33904/g.72381 Transcript_33904/m.72381 type:complete len:254 (-) Transcript_33904:145-906(-)